MPSFTIVAGGSLPASIHISMVGIIIIQFVAHSMALFGPVGEVRIIPSNLQR